MSTEADGQETTQTEDAAPEAGAAPLETGSAPQPEEAAAPRLETPSAEAGEVAGEAAPETPAGEPVPETSAGAPEPPEAEAEAKPKPAKAKRKRPPRVRRPRIPKDLPRSRAPLPLDELRDASRATLELFGREGIRESFLILAPRERQDISALIARDEDHRPRTRNIANGSLGAGRIDKAMSATIISMAKVEDLWAVTLDKETAAEKIGRIRRAKQRDQQKADRAKERANRADRVSREDMQKAQDGKVGATIRIVTDEPRERGKKDEPAAEKPKRESVLDRLGY